MMKLILFSSRRWLAVEAKLNPKEKRFLKRYYSSLYPREYVRKLVAFLNNGVQFKESETKR